MECIYCAREINNKGSLSAHQSFCIQNPNKKTKLRSPAAGQKKGSIPWNKGKTKDTDSRVSRPQFVGRRFGLSLTGHTKESKKNLSEIAKARKLGGYVRGSGRGKKGWYKGIFCDSSWELAYVIFCLEHNIDIKRNKDKRKYIWDKKEHNYTPDFIVEGKVIEIKGWSTPRWRAKHKSNPDIEVLFEKDLQNIFKYVINKYSKDYIKLYEKRK